MGINTLPSRADGVPMPNTWFNDIHTAIKLDWVPRNASGIKESEAGSVGTVDYPWFNGRFSNIYLDGNLVDPGTVTGKPHRIVSAAQDGTTRYPGFLDPAGVAGGLSCDLLATATAFGAVINNIQTDVTADATFSALTAAPAANNTCLIDDLDLAGGDETKTLGELDNKPLTIDTIGTEISDRKGEIAAFKIGTEIFLAEIDTDNSRLLPIYRGWAGTARGVVSNNDTVTLMQFNVLLLKNDGSTKVASVYYPDTATTSPAAGTAGKIYIERDTNKIGYDTGAAIDYDYMILGYAVCDDTDCINAQIYDLELSWNKDIDIEFQIKDTTTIAIQRNADLSVNGQRIEFSENYDITQAANMDSGEAIAASTWFYIYMKEDGSAVFSTVAPRKYDAIKKGEYHPLKYFRCIGQIYADSGNSWLLKRREKKTLETIRDEGVPVGTTVAYNSGCFGDGSNGTFDPTLGHIGILALQLADSWRICNGDETYDPESPIFNASGRFIENLTDDRFLMGDTVPGGIGGDNSDSHVHQWNNTIETAGMVQHFTLDTPVDSVVTIDNGDYHWQTDAQTAEAGATVDRAYMPSEQNKDLYTTGALSTRGNYSETNDNRPNWLGCIYVRKIK